MIELILWAVGIYVGLWALVGLGASIWAWFRLAEAYVVADRISHYQAKGSEREPDAPP